MVCTVSQELCFGSHGGIREKTEVVYELFSYNFPKAVIQFPILAPNSRNMMLLAKGRFCAYNEVFIFSNGADLRLQAVGSLI